MGCDDTLGDRLKKAREGAGLSQQAVADRVLPPGKDGTHRKNTIYEWEKGKYQPDPSELEKLVPLYGVNGHWLLTGEGPADVTPPDMMPIRLRIIGKIAEGGALDAQALHDLVRLTQRSPDATHGGPSEEAVVAVIAALSALEREDGETRERTAEG